MKRLIVILALTLTACNTPKESTNAHIIHAMNATVQIFTEDGGRGSGFYIGNGQIVTAFHVVSDLEQRTFYNFNDVLHELKMVKYNQELDLAVMKMAIPVSLPILKFSNTEPQVGDRVYTIGYHFGHSALKVASHGHVTALCDYEGKQRDYTFFNASINRGASGGPVINHKGEVIGVNQMIYTNTGDWSGIGMSIRFEHLKWFMVPRSN